VRQPGDLGVLQTNVLEEARTRGFASLTLVRFAFYVPSHGDVGGHLKSWEARMDKGSEWRVVFRDRLIPSDRPISVLSLI
jgi:hypothetical protein